MAGVEIGRETSDPTRIAYTGVLGTSLIAPNMDQPFFGIPSVSAQLNTVSSTYSAYI